MHRAFSGGVAQLVEQGNHNPWVGGSSPSSATTSPCPNVVRCDDGASQIEKGLSQRRFPHGCDKTFEMGRLRGIQRPLLPPLLRRSGSIDVTLLQPDAVDDGIVSGAEIRVDAIQNDRLLDLHRGGVGRCDDDGEGAAGDPCRTAVLGGVAIDDVGPVGEDAGAGKALAPEGTSRGLRQDPSQMDESSLGAARPVLPVRHAVMTVCRMGDARDEPR